MNHMIRRTLIACIVFAALGTLAPAACAASPAEPELEWKIYVDLDRQIFPSLIVSTAAIRVPDDEEKDESILGEQDGMIGISIANAPEGAKARLVIKANHVLDESTVTGPIPKGDSGCLILPRMNWKFDLLLKHRQVEPLNLVMELFINGVSQGSKSDTVTLRSLNDCPLFAEEVDEDGKVVENGDGQDYTWMFAAYVNENHPWVDEVTKEALQAGIVEQFDGYQSGNSDKVLEQVFAIWNVLQRRGMKYSDISTESAQSPVVFSQHVRLFDESVKATQANCVDGSVLFASILRKIGINPHLVLVPGHCFLAFELDAQGEAIVGLETTMMGGTNLKKYDRKKISETLREEYKNKESWEAFSAAIEAGSSQIEEAGDKFDNDDEVQYQMISVANARKLGILPLAWKKD